jgi:peroxiredoxin
MFVKLTMILLLITSAVFALDAGDKAADFALKNGGGQEVKLADFSGKNVVVIFISTKCPYSQAFNKVMADLSKDYAAKGITVIGINSNKAETAADVAAHAKEHLKFQVLKDEENKVADLYGAQVTPEAFVIDGKGMIRYHGALGNSKSPTTDASRANSDDIRSALDELIAGKQIAKDKTKAFGCSIKRV